MNLIDRAVRDQASLRSLLTVLSEDVLATDRNGVRQWSNAVLAQATDPARHARRLENALARIAGELDTLSYATAPPTTTVPIWLD